MALVISTKDQLYLTGLQQRAVNKSRSIAQGTEILNAGNKLLVTIKGGTTNTLSIATGFAILSGVEVENTTVVEKTFGNPSTAGNYVLVFKIDMSTNTPSLNTQLASVSRTTNDLTVTTNGIYEFVLATMTVSATGVISNLVPTTPLTYMVQQGVTNFFKPTTDQALVASTPATIGLAKEVGDLVIASNLITLPKGYYYKLRFGFGASGASHTGACQAKIVKSDGSAVGNGVNAKGRSVTGNWGEHSNSEGLHLIDLTSAGADIQIKYYMEVIETSCSLDRFNTHLEIEKYVKAV